MKQTVKTEIDYPPVIKQTVETEIDYDLEKIFIVHGHDKGSKHELARILTDLGLKPIILNEKANAGKTLVEKLEHYAKVGYVFILLTPDDICKSARRARQNVILELGYFMGFLGRKRVCCLYKGTVELPTDIGGVAYWKFNTEVRELYKQICDELQEAKYQIEK